MAFVISHLRATEEDANPNHQRSWSSSYPFLLNIIMIFLLFFFFFSPPPPHFHNHLFLLGKDKKAE